MKIIREGYDLHILVCTNEKEGGRPSCGPKGGQTIVDHLKGWLKEQRIPGKVRVNRSGCLGKCESGIACVAYPAGQWVLEATPEDLPRIEQWILEFRSP
ncbi:(2Fe-2S) ferredoxin domain-containing protein [bacterium]|jgi:(2Fe-2S) ferredoxin|nr:(2Fe-2S) ferredoxin domain-containing protein [bacterium]